MARRRRDGRRESNIYQIFVISPSVIFLLKNDSSLVRGSLCWTAARAVPTVRRRLLRIVRNSLWLSLTHYATPPFPQKSRSARLFGCKRSHDGSLSLPTFADYRTAARVVPTVEYIFHSVRSTHFFSLFTFHSSLPDRAFAIVYAIPYSIKILGGFA